MGNFLKNLSLTRISSGLAVVLLLCAATSLVQAQAPPLVYTVENTGASLPLTGTLPTFAQAPIIRQLPDPFVFLNGTRDTTWASYEQHRQEWIAAIEASEQGPKPTCTGNPANDSVLGVTYTCSETASFTHTSGTTYSVTMIVTVVGPTSATNLTPTTHTLTSSFNVVLPAVSATFTPSTSAAAGTCGPVPANGYPIIMGMGSATGSWPATAFTTTTKAPANVTVSPTGCAATVSFPYTAFAAYITSDTSHANDGFRKLYPTLCAGSTTATTAGSCTIAQGFTQNGSNSGDYAEWAYGMSRTLDALQMVSSQAYCNAHSGACPSNTALPIDITHSATSGCSYAGKMAMWTAAWDERVALGISQENGGGGAPSWRISHEIETQGSVEDSNDTDYDWFDTTQHQYDWYGVYKDPEDHFEVMAMTAPRALLQTGDSAYYWLGDRSATFDSLAAAKVYDNYGIADRFGYYIDTVHSHCAVPAYQQNATQPTINRFLFGTTTAPNAPAIPRESWLFGDSLQAGAQPTYDPNFWTAWWGTGTPAFPAGEVWNWGGDVMLPLNQNITLNTGDTITSQFQVTMPGTHAAGIVTVPTSFAEVDVACTDGSSYTFSVPNVPSTYYNNPNTITITANDNSVHPSAVATGTNPGCSNGQPGHTTGTYFFALGKTNPGAGNPGLQGFSTTNGVQLAGTTDPLQVTFNLADSTTSQGGAWSPWTTLNYQNPYSCTPNGCPITPTITWAPPASITSGTPLSSTQLNAAASETEIAGLNPASGTPAAGTGLLTTLPISGTWSYNPPAGTVLSPGVHTLTATFTPASGTIYTTSITAANAYKYETIATASVPISVLVPQTVSLTATATVTGSHAGGYTMTISVKNTGTGPASNVVLSAATLGSTSGTPLPQTLSTIAAGGTGTFSVSVPGSAGADGAGVAEKFSGTYTGGTFSASIRSVTLP